MRRPRSHGLVLLITVGLLGACSRGSDSPSFTIESTNPAALSVSHSVDAPVQVTFNEALDGSTLGPDTVYLLFSGSTVSTQRSYDSESRTVTLTPIEPLAHGAQYSIVVTTELISMSGLTLSEVFTQRFSTADERLWSTETILATDHPNLIHLTVDRQDHYHLLAASSVTGGPTWYLEGSPELAWQAPIELSAQGAAGFDLDVDGRPRGVLITGITGSYAPIGPNGFELVDDIPVQSPGALPPGTRWPDPFLYRWIPGGPHWSAIRIGPMVSTPSPSFPTCRVLTGGETFDCTYVDGEEVWGAIISPYLARWVVGGTRSANEWFWRPSLVSRIQIAELPAMGQNWTARIATNPNSNACAAWIEDRSSNPGTAPHTTSVRAAVLSNDFWSNQVTFAERIVPNSNAQLAASAGYRGDAMVGWSSDLDTGARILEVAHYWPFSEERAATIATPGVGSTSVAPPAWQIGQLSTTVDDGPNSFALTHDGAGHAFIAWVDVELGERKLWLRHFDPRVGWLEKELVTESGTQDIGNIHLVTDSRNRVLMAWKLGPDVVARRYQ